MKVQSRDDAWRLAARLFPTDYVKDERGSKNAGYPIYQSTAEGRNCWISDLGNRLELNYDNGKSENIWIEECEAKHFPSVIVGIYTERPVFGNVKVMAVEEIQIDNCEGFVLRDKYDKGVNYEFTISGVGTKLIPQNDVAYIRFEQR